MYAGTRSTRYLVTGFILVTVLTATLGPAAFAARTTPSGAGISTSQTMQSVQRQSVEQTEQMIRNLRQQYNWVPTFQPYYYPQLGREITSLGLNNPYVTSMRQMDMMRSGLDSTISTITRDTNSQILGR